jgi:hypothetical protein
MSVRDIEFQEAIRRASERYGKHKRAVQQIWRRAEDSPTYALSTARELAVKTRYWRRRGRRYLYSRFGVKVRSRRAATIYAGVRPERSPGSSRERLLRAEAVIEHAEWESVWRAVWKCQNFGPADQARMACKFACEAMRQSPALWGFFIEKDLEPDDSVRQHAAAQLAGWLDNEVRRFPRTRATGLASTREEKLEEIAAVAAEAWSALQPGEPFWLPNTYVRGFGERRKKGWLAGLLIKCHLRLLETHGEQKNGHRKLPSHDAPLKLYGQEINPPTFAMAKMNAAIHEMQDETALGDTMNHPAFRDEGGRLERFDLIAANPMWNQKFPTEVYEHDPYERFDYGVPPSASADWGWVQHMVSSLEDQGRMAVVLDTGAVSRGSGNTGSNRERDIRKIFVEGSLMG